MAPGSAARATVNYLTAIDPHAEFRAALEADQVSLFYQPQVELQTGALIGAEALLRWRHPTGGLLEPDSFLPMLANTEVMPSITRWVLDAACRVGSGWDSTLSVAVNVTGRDVSSPAFARTVTAALERHHLSGSQLTIELTEQDLLQDPVAATAQLEMVRAAGATISLDDFGTGYSSLLYLRDLPVDEIKVDRSFISGLTTTRENHAIVTALLQLADAIGIRVLAEGVETHEQARMLADMGCQRAQGYYFGRPAATLAVIDRGINRPVQDRRRRPRPSPAGSAAMRTICDLLSQGASLHTIAAALNRSGVRTADGLRWHAATVAKALSHRESA